MPERNFENRTLYHGDNLEFLKGINSGTVNLIATDPPFNKNRDFHATPDSLARGARFVDRWRWDEDVHQEWVDEIQDDFPGVWQAIENGRINHSLGMAAFLCWMAVRLIQMHRVLADDGSIYLHLDHTAHAYAKSLMDAIFGWSNFRNEIVWCYKSGGRAKVHFPRKHDSILWYSKNYRNYIFNYDAVSLPRDTSTMHEPVLVDETGREYQRNFKNGKEYRYYLNKGVLPNDWWIDIQVENPASKNRTGYPTQKPVALYERIIKASSNPGDFVLDPFCGCATTPIAAERLSRQWIGMDIWDGAYNVVKERLESIGLTSDAANDNRLVTLGDIIYTTTPPGRTDETDDDPDVPDLNIRPTRVKAKWELLTHAEMRDILAEAQSNGDTIICSGCGIALPVRYMQLDHNLPRKDGGENVITNRLLLCGPCNLSKSASRTLSGLRDFNRREGYMTDRDMAELASSKARDAAERCRIEIV